MPIEPCIARGGTDNNHEKDQKWLPNFAGREEETLIEKNRPESLDDQANHDHAQSDDQSYKWKLGTDSDRGSCWKENEYCDQNNEDRCQKQSNYQEEWLEISSPCDGSYTRLAWPDWPDWHSWGDQPDWHSWGDKPRWTGFCPCCKRPLNIELKDEPPFWKRRRCSTTEERCAYVIALWGSSSEYVLGAMVLGKSLRKTGTKHDLVLLHTDDVIPSAVTLLQRAGWIPKKMDHIEASENLYGPGCLKMRFAKVFTKLNVFALAEYSKVLMMDIDLLVQDNIDDLFHLPAPAALVRGPSPGYYHGELARGHRFFCGGWSEPVNGHWGNSWGMSSGINAGVMLLKPDMEVFNQMLLEVKQPHHPEHIRANGPEQDYLSRFFADCWTHISVAYNFQLHQMWFALSPGQFWRADRREFIENSDKIKVIHYSGELKPWSRFLESRYANYSDDEWLDEALRSFSGYWAWALRDPEEIRHQSPHDGLLVGPNGKTVHWPRWESDEETAPADDSKTSDEPLHNCRSLPNDDATATVDNSCTSGEVSALPELGPALEVPEFAINGATEATRMSYKSWDTMYEQLAEELEEPGLAKLVLASVTDTEVTDKNRASTSGEPDDWSKESGWWVENPVHSRAVAYCGNVPRPQVVFSADGAEVLSESCPGVHAACITAGVDNDGVRRASRIFSGSNAASDAGDWATSIADDSLVMVAAVVSDDSQRDSASQILAAFNEGGLSCPSSLPSRVFVAAAIGRKGSSFWHSQAAVDQVMVSMNTSC